MNGKIRRVVHKIPASDGRKIAVIEWIPESKRYPLPVLFVHGYSQNHLTWEGKKGGMALELCKNGIHTFAVDLRGSGYSSYPGPYYFVFEDFIFKDIPSALKVLKARGYSRFVIAGHSMGGTVAYVWTSQNPDTVAGVITFGSPILYGKGVPPMRELGKLVFKIRKAKNFREDALTLLLKILVPKEPFMKMGGLVGISSYPLVKLKQVFKIFPLFPSYPRNFEGFSEFFEKLGPGFDFSSVKLLVQILTWAGSWQILSWDGKINWTDHIGKINHPLLVVSGKLDKLAPPESVEPIQDIVSSRYVKFRVYDVGHLDVVEGKVAREKISKDVIKFLSELD